ncbi:heavy-metal-associated domain-containing protein [Halobellus litoreus]|uniref:Heavy-metal-associated domain-containing protein n=1 Tax=Halobellus litoreus TaxID=755310 RepID=A0ABD6E403_9EURY|nr:cation transporter [Halobellus litoreus]
MTTTITVEGMSCGHCEQTVEEALEEVSGVTAVTVDRESEQASVDGEAEVTALVEAVEDAGYNAHA